MIMAMMADLEGGGCSTAGQKFFMLTLVVVTKQLECARAWECPQEWVTGTGS